MARTVVRPGVRLGWALQALVAVAMVVVAVGLWRTASDPRAELQAVVALFAFPLGLVALALGAVIVRGLRMGPASAPILRGIGMFEAGLGLAAVIVGLNTALHYPTFTPWQSPVLRFGLVAVALGAVTVLAANRRRVVVA